ncbi:DUF6056 family protein [Streptomyces lydicus]|uniref:DUF6056 family protein n=1 Tax=Streptomyces lydicus TaxID=47763 RepID=UPI0036F7B9A8
MDRLPEKTVRGQKTADAPDTNTLVERAGWWPLLLCTMSLALLTYAAWAAQWVRPGGDDWCFLPVVRDGGLTSMVDEFYFRDNGRVVNAVLVWAYARFGVAGQQWFAPVSGALILLLLWAFCAAALHATEKRLPRGTALFMAATVTTVFLLGSLNTYKTFYWPAASVSHTLPPVFACAATAPVLRAVSPWGRAFALFTAVTTGAALGLLSEETTVVALVALGCTVVISRRVMPAMRRRFVRLWCAAAITGLVIGSLVLYTSPGALHRRQTKNSSIMLTPKALWESLYGFTYIACRCLTSWPYLGALAGGVILGCLLVRASPERVTRAKNEALLIWSCILVLVIGGYACTVITYPAFRTGVMTSTRLWNDYLLLYVLLLVYAGALAARAWHRRGQQAHTALAAGTAVYSVVCVCLAASLAAQASAMAARARAWDQQDVRMRAQAAAGARVLPYRRLSISKMTEPFRKDGHKTWLALCVARYYRVQDITNATGKR